MNKKFLALAFLTGSMMCMHSATAADAPKAPPAPAKPARPTPPTRDPNTDGFVKATELPDGAVPPADADGNFIIGADSIDQNMFKAIDGLIPQKRIPVMIGVSIGNGSGDAQGNERGLEYDTMSGKYAEFVETEVLPRVEKEANVKLTKDPEGR